MLARRAGTPVGVVFCERGMLLSLFLLLSGAGDARGMVKEEEEET